MKVKMFSFEDEDNFSKQNFTKEVEGFLNSILTEATLKGCIIAPLIVSCTSTSKSVYYIITYNIQNLQTRLS